MPEVSSRAYSKEQIVKHHPMCLYSGENDVISNNQNPPQHLDWSIKEEEKTSYFGCADDDSDGLLT